MENGLQQSTYRIREKKIMLTSHLSSAYISSISGVRRGSSKSGGIGTPKLSIWELFHIRNGFYDLLELTFQLGPLVNPF